jgi:hypothetical protein
MQVLMSAISLFQSTGSGFFELLDQDFIQWLATIKNDYVGRETMFLGHARLFSAIFCFIYLSGRAYNILAGDSNWEIMPLLRPFGIGLIILNWTAFVSLINAPFDSMENTVQNRFDTALTLASTRLTEREKLHSEYALMLIEKSDEIENYQKTKDDDKESMTIMGFDMSAISDKIAGLGILIMSKFNNLLESLILSLGQAFFRICFYLILFLEIFFKYILVVLGPIAFAFSILPQFRDSGVQWIGRFVSISFYPILALLMALISINVINYAILQDIDLIKNVIKDDDSFMAFVTSSHSMGQPMLISFIMGGVAMLTIPSVSQWIVQSSGVGKALGKLAQGASMATGGIKKIGK